MSVPDLGRFDELELLDVSDEQDDPLGSESEPGEDGTADSPAGRLVGGLVAAVAARVAPVAAPLERVRGSIGRATLPLASRLPAAVLAGAVGFAGVLVVTLIGTALLRGGQSAEAGNVAGRPTAVKSSAAGPSEAPRRPDPAPTPTPAAPTPTPAPETFQPQGEGWLAIGRFSPEPRHVLPAGRLLLFADERETFTITTKLSVLLQSGPLAPWWGILLSYRGEQEHVRLEFFTDSYDRNRPYVGLLTTKGGPSKAAGPNARLWDIDFWGRERHEVRVVVGSRDVELWLDDRPAQAWKRPGDLASGQKGLYLWGNSRLRVDSFSVE